MSGRMRWAVATLLLVWLQLRECPGCETGVAHVQSVLSVPRSLLANADVALLHNYHAASLARCMEECCAGTYGSCSVASFKRNATKENCMHFYCRPLTKCKFLSSNSTDSFSFSSETRLRPKPIPTVAPKSATKEEIATYSDEQFALKNDNTTVKPRKGVEDDAPLEDLHPKSSVKPRKGVSTQDVPHSELIPNSLNKSNVKARKGVPNSTEVPQSSAKTEPPHDFVPVEDIDTKELMSALQNVFEDDIRSTSVESSSTSSVMISPTLASTQIAYSTSYGVIPASSTRLLPSYTTETSQMVPSSRTKTLMDRVTYTRQFVSAAVEEQIVPFSSSPTPVLSPTTTQIRSSEASSLGEGFHQIVAQPSSLGEDFHQKLVKPSSLGEGFHQKLVKPSSLGRGFHEKLVASEEETEADRRYTSSMHLVLSLVFGLLVLFAVLGVVAKRVYDGWVRRDYYRMNYLIDGIYNGVD